MRKIAIGFVAYNPNQTLISRMALATDADFTVYLCDNSPDNGTLRDFCKGHHHCRYFTCGKNVGLGFGLSLVCAQAYYDGYPALLFFDQDTIFDRSTLNFMQEFYNAKSDSLGNYSSIVFNSKNAGNVDRGNKFSIKDVLMSINSGSLFFLENLKKMNWHNVSYFVDCVDYEFCLNANNRGFKIGECSNAPGFDHKAEQGDFEYKVFGKVHLLRRYPLRRVFNTIYASTKIFLTAVKKGNKTFTLAIIRFFAIYLSFQIIARLKNITATKKGN